MLFRSPVVKPPVHHPDKPVVKPPKKKPPVVKPPVHHPDKPSKPKVPVKVASQDCPSEKVFKKIGSIKLAVNELSSIASKVAIAVDMAHDCAKNKTYPCSFNIDVINQAASLQLQVVSALNGLVKEFKITGISFAGYKVKKNIDGLGFNLLSPKWNHKTVEKGLSQIDKALNKAKQNCSSKAKQISQAQQSIKNSKNNLTGVIIGSVLGGLGGLVALAVIMKALKNKSSEEE